MAEHYFKKVFKGYDPEQVDSFLVELSDKYTQKERALSEELNAAGQEIERLKSRVAELQDEALIAAGEHQKELDEKGREYEQLCARAGESVVNADKIASDIVDRAEKDAEREAYAIRERAEREARNRTPLRGTYKGRRRVQKKAGGNGKIGIGYRAQFR